MTPDPAEIKAALRRCQTVPEVNACAIHYRDAVAGLKKSADQDLRTDAIQIINLAAYRRTAITGKWNT